jgi:hypothetical protein
VRPRKLASITLVLLVGCAQHALGVDLKLLLLHSKTGRPVHGKKFCVSFSRGPDVANFQETCGRTDPQGTMIVALPKDSTDQWAHISSRTNDFLPCFAHQPFATTELAKTGVIAPNTCGPERNDLKLQPGMLVLYGHQMSFWEAIKGEIP